MTSKHVTLIILTKEKKDMNLRFRIASVAALSAAALALGTGSAQAAPGFSISLTGPDTGVVGKPVLFKVSGTNPPPAEYWFNTYMQVEAIPASVIDSCPSSYLGGVQLAQNTWVAGGHHLAGPATEVRDAAGNWSGVAGYTPSVRGRILICAYSQNVSDTLAMREHMIEVAAAGAAGKGKKCKRAKRGAAAAAKKCRKRR